MILNRGGGQSTILGVHGKRDKEKSVVVELDWIAVLTNITLLSRNSQGWRDCNRSSTNLFATNPIT